MPVPADLERLREALVELDRLRLHERALRLETEGLLRGMRMLGAAHDADELFDAVVGVLRDLVPFEQAFLVALGGRGGFRVVRSTLRRLLSGCAGRRVGCCSGCWTARPWRCSTPPARPTG